MANKTSKKELRNKRRKLERKKKFSPASDNYFHTCVLDDGSTITYNAILVGKNIKKYRMANYISQYELSLIMGVDKDAIKMWELGKHLPPLEGLNYLALSLSVPLHVLIGVDETAFEKKSNEEVLLEEYDRKIEEFQNKFSETVASINKNLKEIRSTVKDCSNQIEKLGEELTTNSKNLKNKIDSDELDIFFEEMYEE